MCETRHLELNYDVIPGHTVRTDGLAIARRHGGRLGRVFVVLLLLGRRRRLGSGVTVAAMRLVRLRDHLLMLGLGGVEQRLTLLHHALLLHHLLVLRDLILRAVEGRRVVAVDWLHARHLTVRRRR